jgi:bifunctional DNase/RNase
MTAIPADGDPTEPAGTKTEVMLGNVVGGAPDEPVYTIPSPAVSDPSPDPAADQDPAADPDPTVAADPDLDAPDPDPDLTPGADLADQPLGDFKLALVVSVSVDLPNQYPTVVLRESESPYRQLSFSVGLQDGTVLSHAIRRIATPRPLTHELLSGILQGFDIDIVAVRLVGRQGAVYFAELDLRGRNGRSVLSCRPSDGLTLALLQPVPVPILIDRRLLEQDGDVIPPGPA